VLGDHHDGVCDIVVVGERGFHLTELDPISAHLDLFVRAADEFDLSGGVAAGEVSGAVQPSARQERIGDEAFRVNAIRTMYSGSVAAICARTASMSRSAPGAGTR
jgi:hypothetical protein